MLGRNGCGRSGCVAEGGLRWRGNIGVNRFTALSFSSFGNQFKTVSYMCFYFIKTVALYVIKQKGN